MTDMKLSQPKAARTINTARVFGCLRTHQNLSKAEIAARAKKAEELVAFLRAHPVSMPKGWKFDREEANAR